VRVSLGQLLRFGAVAVIVVGIVVLFFDRMFYGEEWGPRYLYEGALIAAGLLTWFFAPLAKRDHP
jgi:hypothetical protein